MWSIGPFAHDTALSFLALIILLILMAVSSIAVNVKRLHDRNKSGWWLLLFFVCSAILNSYGAESLQWSFSMVPNLLAILIAGWMIVELGF
jgi:uncharacterized membrane protein YhaH (DUF805 family)